MAEGIKLYVGNLPYSYLERDLEDMFQKYNATLGKSEQICAMIWLFPYVFKGKKARLVWQWKEALSMLLACTTGYKSAFTH